MFWREVGFFNVVRRFAKLGRRWKFVCRFVYLRGPFYRKLWISPPPVVSSVCKITRVLRLLLGTFASIYLLSVHVYVYPIEAFRRRGISLAVYKTTDKYNKSSCTLARLNFIVLVVNGHEIFNPPPFPPLKGCLCLVFSAVDNDTGGHGELYGMRRHMV